MANGWMICRSMSASPRLSGWQQPTRMALKALGMPLKRAEALIHLANAALEGSLPMTIPGDVEQAMKTLQTFPGIGRWTANYFALRGWQAKDVFLPDDYLIKQRFPGMTPAQIRRYAERWKPWRSYALLHIWYTEGWHPEEAELDAVRASYPAWGMSEL